MIIFLLILSVLVGVFLGKYFGGQQKFAKNLLILSAGFLITICLNDVFPEVYAEGNANIGIFVLSTYNTDYILVRQPDFAAAAIALRTAGYTVLGA